MDAFSVIETAVLVVRRARGEWFCNTIYRVRFIANRSRLQASHMLSRYGGSTDWTGSNIQFASCAVK